jgi:autotransporter-associated beta strand protein
MKNSRQNQSNHPFKTHVFYMQTSHSNRSNLPLLMLALAISVFSTAAAFAAADTWAGGASPNGNWNIGGNWLAGIAPSPYDSLMFTNQTGSAETATNDFAAGTAFDGITFGASAAGSPFKLVGSSILLSGNTKIVTIGITNSTSLSETVSNNLILDWGLHTFYSPTVGSSLNLNGSILANLGAVANFGTNNAFGTNNVNSTVYVQDASGLIAGLGAAASVGNTSPGGGPTALATVSNGVVVGYNSYSSSNILSAVGPIGVDDTTALTTGFGNGATVTSVVVSSATGIHVGAVMGGIGVPSGSVTVTSTAGTTVNVSSFTATAASSGNYTFSSVASDPANIEFTALNGNFPGAGGTNVGFGVNNSYVNTILITNGVSAAQALFIPGYSGTMVLGSTNAGTGMYVGGIYLPAAPSSATVLQVGTNGPGAQTYLTAGPMSGSPVPGEIVIGVSGTAANNAVQINSIIKDNLSGGAVSVVGYGGGSYNFTTNNTYTGGTYVLGGQCQGNYPNAFSIGPVYIASGNCAVFYNLNNVSIPNNFFISPGNAWVAGNNIGALKLGNNGGGGITTNTGTITLMGNPITPGTTYGTTSATVGNRISGQNGTHTFLGQITGSGTLELSGINNAANTFILNNTTANANNWTGGLIIDGSAANAVKLLANNQLATNTVTIIQPGTSLVKLDLNGFSDTINGLSSVVSGYDWVTNGAASAATLTLGVGNATATFGGKIVDGGAARALAIVKTGTGTQTFNGTNTYTGNTTIAGGTLALSGSGSISTTPNIIINNGTFDISAANTYGGTSSIGMTNGTFKLGAVLATAVGNLAVTNSTLNFPLNLSSTAVTASGSFATAGATNVINLSTVPGGSYPIQVTLIKYGSADPNLVNGNNQFTTLGVTFPVLAHGVGYLTNNVANQSVDLVMLSGPPPLVPITWNGQTNGVNVSVWDNLVTLDWLTTSGGAPYPYQDGSVLTFDDTVTGSANVNLMITASPGSMNFNNNGKAYTITGAGQISGAASLTELGTGMLIMDNSGVNDYTGGNLIGVGATAQMGNNDANGVLAGSITNNGTLIFARSDATLTKGNVISGTGTLINNGTGTVTLTAINTYTGPTIVNAGNLVLNHGNAGTSTLGSSSGLTINTNGTVQIGADNSLAGSTVAIGTLPVTINAGGLLTGSPGDDAGAGVSCHIRGLLTLNGGTLSNSGTSINTSAGSWDLDGGVMVNSGPNYGVTSTINCLSVVPTEAGGTIFNVTAGSEPTGIDLLVSGTIIHATGQPDTGIIINGNGVMELDNNNSYAGGTTVNAGTVQLGAASDTGILTALGTGPVTLNGGSVLRFSSSKGITVPGVIADDSTGTLLLNSGTNTLSGANTYSGNTIVNNGGLVLTASGTINNSASITVSNATLDISFGGVVNSYGSINLTNSAFNVGTNLVTGISSLAFGKTTLTFAANLSYANIVDYGSLTINGPTNVIHLTFVPGQPVYPTNITLIKYGSFANVNGGNSLTNLGLILPPLGSVTGYLTNNTVNGSIDLVVTANGLTPVFPITWTGETKGVNAGNWDFATTNWVTTSDGMTPYIYQDTAAVIFDDSATGTTNVVLNTNVSPGSITFNNMSKIYTVTGTGQISGLVGVNLTGSGTVKLAETGGDKFTGGVIIGYNGGTLILSNANTAIFGGMTVNSGELIDQHSGTFTGNLTLNGGVALLDQTGVINGNTVINSGTVQLGNNDGNGSLPSGTLTDNDTLILDRSDFALSLANVIGGYGQVIKNGPGTVTLTAVETYTGPTIVNAGILVLNHGNNSPSTLSSSSGLTINTNGTVQVGADNSLSGSAGNTGYLPVTINAGGLLTGLPGDDAGAGVSCHIRGLLTLNGGTLSNSGTSINTANGSWDLDGGVMVNSGPNYGVTSTINCLSIAPTEAGGTTFIVTAGDETNGIDLLVSGSIIHATGQPDTGINLMGNGVMVLDNNNTYTGGTTLYGGTLQLGMPSDTNAWATPLGSASGWVNINNLVLEFNSGMGVTVSNIIADNGSGIVLSQNGTNYIAATNTYTGITIVSGGILALEGSGSINGSSSIIVSNATLDISATSALFANTGSLLLTNSSLNLGTNLVTSLGSLALSNATLNLSLSSSVTNLNIVNNSGTLTTGGTTNMINVTSLTGLPVYPTNITLISYLSADPNLVDGNNRLTKLGVSLPTLGHPVGYLTNLNNSIQLVLLSGLPEIAPITWNGQTNGVNVGIWDIATTTDWLVGGVTPYPYQDISALTFDDTAAGTTAINLTAAVSPSSMTFNNVSKIYTISGVGHITGATVLNVVGTGTLIMDISGTNNYTGGNLIGAGATAQIGNYDANAGILNGVITNNGTLIFALTSAQTKGNNIAGTGTLITSGMGTITLAGTKTYTGPTIVSNGTLIVSGSLASGAVTVVGGTLAGSGPLNGQTIVQSGGMLSPGVSGIGTLAISNTLSLQGTVAMDINKTTGTNDAIVGLTAVTYGGTLAMNNLSGTLTTNDAFKLFSAGTYGGAFASITPATPGVGLTWNTNTLTTDGVLRVALASAPLSELKFTASPVISGTSLLISATNSGSGTVYLLTSTNVGAPLSTWTPVWTNVLTGSGSFTTNLFNAVNPVLHQQFYLLSNTNN